MHLSIDTIAAIATARGVGGIGIIRISGSSALPILQQLFKKRPRQNNISPTQTSHIFVPKMLEHGWILSATGEVLDEVLSVYMPGPHTFTGEDIVEINCHGGIAVLEAVLEAILAQGARLAEPGEFTRRAFLNGRLDLSQAEAVAEMIAAPTLQGVFLARNKLEGRLGQQLNDLREKLDWLRARLYLAIDFPEDDDSGSTQNEFNLKISKIRSCLKKLILSHEQARLWREGAKTVLAGQVNAGKSSLLNALLGRKRALVSDQPGTTRDFIEESMVIEGLPVRLIDTAGLRSASDTIEAEGIMLAKELCQNADLILLVLDAARFAKKLPDNIAELQPDEIELIEQYGPQSNKNKIFLVLNKSDLLPDIHVLPETLLGCPAALISAKEYSGLTELTQKLYQTLTANRVLDFQYDAAPNLRQHQAIKQALAELESLEHDYQAGIPEDLLSVRLDSAAGYLTEVTGTSSTEEILDRVFANFCIGK